ncbi:MAG: hypothetical protein ACE5FJ_00375 [Gemmatimonadales bacterium]
MNRIMALLLGALVAGCELTEVTVPNGEPVVVVQAVVRPDLPTQTVFVERSFTGQANIVNNVDPIVTATVSVRNLTRPALSCAPDVVFSLQDPNRGRYDSPAGCLRSDPGDTLELTVDVPGEGLVMGRLEVPGIRRLLTWNNGVPLPRGGIAFQLNRETDTLRFLVEPWSGEVVEVETQSLVGLGILDRRSSFFLDSMAFQVPGNMSVDVEDGIPLFRAGRFTTLAIGLGDENYFRFLLTRNDPIVGRGFDNRLAGGIGVFGALEAQIFSVRTVGTIDDEREGSYRLSGSMGAEVVDVELELYLADGGDVSGFSAFFTGVWPGFTTRLNTSIDGRFEHNRMEATLDLSLGTEEVIHFAAANALQPSFQVTVLDESFQRLGTLTATR